MKFVINHTLVLVCAAALSACSSSSETTTVTSDSEVKPISLAAATAVATSTELATVAAVDPAARTVTLIKPDGSQRTFRCRSDMANFDQIRVGDRVNATISDSIAVYVRQSNEPPFIGEGEAVAIAPRGAKPGMIMANTAEVRARIMAVDRNAGTITIETPGEMTTFAVSPGIDLKKFKKGDDVVLRVTESLALLVEAPNK